MAEESIDQLIRRAERRIGRALTAIYPEELVGYQLRRAGFWVHKEELADHHRVWTAAFGDSGAPPVLKHGRSVGEALARAAEPRRRRRKRREE